MSRKLFAVINTRGPKRECTKPMEEHEGWRAHADFMNVLVAAPWTLRLGTLADP